MTNEEKSKEIANNLITNQVQDDWWYPRAQQHYEEALMEMAQWKDERVKQLLIEKTKPLSPSAAQDSIKRCTIEEIYRELFNEEMSNSNPYIK